MALNTITANIISGLSTSSSHLGPFRDSNGNLYVVSNLRMYKSTNGGSTWVEQDSTGRPTPPGGVAAETAVQDGDTLHLAAHSGFTGGKSQDVNITYHTFTTSDHATTPDEWVIVDEAVVTVNVGDAGDVIEAAGIEIAVRSDGDVIVIHPGSTNTDMGTDYFQLAYSVRIPLPAWNTDNALFTEAVNQGDPRAVMAPNDECHIHYRAAANDYGVTLDSADTLSTRVTITSNGSSRLSGRPITWDNGGTQQILVAFDDAGGPAVRRMQEDGSGDIATDLAATQPQDATPSLLVNGGGLAWDSVNSDAYLFFGDNASDDLFYDKSSHATTAGWGTDVEQEDAVTVNGIWINYYNNTIGYVVLEGTDLKYGELDLSGAAEGAFPPFLRRQLTTVRI